MMSNKSLLVGSDGSVVVWRLRNPIEIEYVAYQKGAANFFIRKTNGQIFGVKATPKASVIEVAVVMVESADPVDTLEALRGAGKVEGAVQFVGADPFAGGWAALVQTNVEKAVTSEIGAAENFALEI